jgi:hypothetical protein
MLDLHFNKRGQARRRLFNVRDADMKSDLP